MSNIWLFADLIITGRFRQTAAGGGDDDIEGDDDVEVDDHVDDDGGDDDD